MKGPEQRTIDVDVESLDTRGRTVTGYAAVYNVPSEPLSALGGAREQIAPGAFKDVMGADVRALLNHDPNEILGRTKSGTLRLSDEQRGLRFELDLPDSPLGENVRSAVRRGDIDGASFRFIVGEERWDDEVRTVTKVAELHDVTLATYPAYSAASIELRTRSKEDPVEDEERGEVTTSTQTGGDVKVTESRTGNLRVADHNAGEPESRTLYGKFRQAGWTPDGGRTEIAWQDYENAAESRALTWTGSVDNVDMLRRDASPFGYDQRWAWPAFPRVPIDSGVTSVTVLTQTARTLATPANVVRAVEAVTAKPESASTITIATVSMKQVASVVSGVPNVYLEQPQIESIIGTDLRLAVNGGLDKLALDATTASGFQAPGTDNILVSVRKAMSTIMASGYEPNTLILTPANAEAIDTMVTGLTGGTADFVFGPGRFAPGTLFGLNVRISKTAAAPIVVDATAFGKLYVSPISLAVFEEGAGSTNTSLVRLEGNAVFGVERQAAAIRIAAA